MNNDVLIEILLCLPVQSLLRFRAVCKFWGNVIDSPSFRKLHTHNNKSNDTVCLQLSFPNDGNRKQKKLSIKFEHNGKSLMSYESDHFNGFSLYYWFPGRVDRFVGEVKGLIYINCYWNIEVPIAICNPFLGQVKILPLTTSSSSNSSCQIVERSVAIGFDEDYKVVQLLLCREHRRLHAQIYSRKTDSWRELAGDDGDLHHLVLDWVCPVEPRCKNGYFAHWLTHRINGSKRIIISLDMKNEVFRTTTVPDNFAYTSFNKIFADYEQSFLSFDYRRSFVSLKD